MDDAGRDGIGVTREGSEMMAKGAPTLEEVTALTALAASGLSDLRDARSALACRCRCHLRRFGHPIDDYHDAGVTCSCQLTSEQRRAARDEWLAELDRLKGDEDGGIVAASTQRARAQAMAAARRLGMSIVIESQHVPLIIRGTLGDTSFWFRERRGSWRLHVGGAGGAQIASGVTDPTPGDAVTLIWDLLDRYQRGRECEHETTAPTDVFCRRCGQRHDRPR